MARSSVKSAAKLFSKNEKRDEPLQYRDKKQVDLDVSRVPISKAAAAKLEKRIGSVLSANPPLHYYQGFHDIAMHTHSTKQLENLALQQLRDFMASDLKPTMQILKLVPELISVCDPTNLGKLFGSEPHTYGESRRLTGYFALAPVVTLFSHDVSETEVISPIIRNVLKEGISYVLYLYVALVIENKDLVLERLRGSTDDDEVDMAFQGLAGLLNRSNYHHIDHLARKLRSHYPLRTLPSYSSISRFSVLKSNKVTKRSTALHMLAQLERACRISTMHTLAIPSRTVVAVAMGAIAVGMLWTRLRK